MTITSQFPDICHRQFFWLSYVFFVKFSYWSKFPVNIITGSGVMTIFFYKQLTRNSEIGSIPAWVLANIWRLGEVKDTKFGMNVFNEMLLNAAKYQGYNFYCFWVIKGKPTGAGLGGGLDPPTQITKVANYEEARVKLTNAQLNKLKSVGKKKTGTTIRITKKTFKMKNYLMNYL